MVHVGRRPGSAGVVSIVASILAASVLTPPAAHASPTLPSAADTVPIAAAEVDRNGDFVPDRLGDTVTVAGRATVATRVLNQSSFRIFLRDSTGGIQLYAEDMGESVDRGDRVTVTGVVDHYHGQTQLVVGSYEAHPGPDGDAGLAPRPLAAPDSATLDSHEGELVRLSGTVVQPGTNDGGDYLWLVPEFDGQRVQVFAARWHSPAVDLGRFGPGDRITATGLLGQYDTVPPHDNYYQLYPRSDDDLRPASVALGLTLDELRLAGGGVLLLVLGGLGLWGLRARRQQQRLSERLDVLFEENRAGVFLTTVEEGEILACNASLARMYGFASTEELRKTRAWDLYPSLADREEYVNRLREEGEVEDYLHRQRTRDGDDVWVVENARLVRRDGGRDRIVGTAVDLTKRIRAQRRQEAAEERYRALFEQNVSGAFRSRPDGELLEVNRAFAEMLGYDDPAELEGRDARELYVSPDRRDELMDALDEDGKIQNEELALRNRSGETVWVLENSFVAEDPGTGRLVNIGTVTEITEHVREERALAEMAQRDPLTGVPNRRYLEETVPRLLALAERMGECVAVVYLDLNDFKEINDRRGHATGDAVLRAVAERLEETVRESDVLGRVGGDEFVVVLTGVEDRSDVVDVTGRLAESAFGEPLEAAGSEYRVRATLGVALCPQHGTDFDVLMARADRAMFRARRAGELTRVWDGPYDEAGEAAAPDPRRVTEALEAGEISGYRQPIYRLDTGRRDGVELLARWERGAGTVVAPGELLPRLRKAGRLADLDRRMLTQAAAYAARWRGGTVSANVSRAFLESEDPVGDLREILGEHPAAGDYLTVEVSERLALGAARDIRGVLSGIVDLGLRLSLDDFGTGYASLSLLERLDVDEVKLDRALVEDVGDGGPRSMLRGVLSLLRELDIAVLAEGIERRDQLEWLREHGCRRAQGFLLGRPVPPGAEPPATVADALEGATRPRG